MAKNTNSVLLDLFKAEGTSEHQVESIEVRKLRDSIDITYSYKEVKKEDDV